jgi:hypothetical protein
LSKHSISVPRVKNDWNDSESFKAFTGQLAGLNDAPLDAAQFTIR